MLVDGLGVRWSWGFWDLLWGVLWTRISAALKKCRWTLARQRAGPLWHYLRQWSGPRSWTDHGRGALGHHGEYYLGWPQAMMWDLAPLPYNMEPPTCELPTQCNLDFQWGRWGKGPGQGGNYHAEYSGCHTPQLLTQFPSHCLVSATAEQEENSGWHQPHLALKPRGTPPSWIVCTDNTAAEAAPSVQPHFPCDLGGN